MTLTSTEHCLEEKNRAALLITMSLYICSFQHFSKRVCKDNTVSIPSYCDISWICLMYLIFAWQEMKMHRVLVKTGEVNLDGFTGHSHHSPSFTTRVTQTLHFLLCEQSREFPSTEGGRP